jgi:signal transduction histidine kinase
MPDSNQSTISSLLDNIQEYFGFVPPFFTTVQDNIELLDSLWHQTRVTYINNPLPPVVKEKIFIYLSYACNVPYDLRYHCILLNAQGVAGDEISTLLHTPLPTEQEILQHVEYLQSIAQPLNAWPQQDMQMELVFFACIAHLFMQRQQAPHCRKQLQRLLGEQYAFLTALFTYIRTCHNWIEADPDTFQEKDQAIVSQFKQAFGSETSLEELLETGMRSPEQLDSAKESQATQDAEAHRIAWQEANQRMDDFLSVTAHELKTPITTIKGTIQMLLRTTRRELQRTDITLEEHKQNLENVQHLLTRADNQIRRLTQLINDMVLISRIQDKKLELRLEYQNFSTFIQEIVKQQRQLNPSRTIRLNNLAQTLPVCIDRDHIEQVLTNYLSNALKYSQENQPISIEVQRIDKKIRCAVHDDGPGITAQDQERIWERFYRVQQTQVQSGSGIGFGLGLYISRSIIERHKGEVGVESKPGQGTTFWFTLQLADPD